MTSSRLEKNIERAACAEILRDYGVQCDKYVSPGRRGRQDRIAFIPGGRPLLMEFKRPGEPLEPLQEHRRAELVKLGYKVVTVDSVGAAKAAVWDMLVACIGLHRAKRVAEERRGKDGQRGI